MSLISPMMKMMGVGELNKTNSYKRTFFKKELEERGMRTCGVSQRTRMIWTLEPRDFTGPGGSLDFGIKGRSRMSILRA